MNKKLLYTVLGIFFGHLLLISCAKKEKLLSLGDVMDKLKKVYPETALVVIKPPEEGPKCKGPAGEFIYAEGCKSATLVKMGDLELTLVEFDSYTKAQEEAKRLNQLSTANWLFDDVVGEPRLEALVRKSLAH